MGKYLIITEKPSVAREFAKALKEQMKTQDGYLESNQYIITWCVGHLVTMSYPDAYDTALKRWSLDTIPFIPKDYRYEVIDNVKKQFLIVKKLFNRDDIEIIYNAGDSGREGEYIQRLVLQMAGYNKNAKLRRIWIDSQTEDEILRGIREAKDMSEYDNLSNAAYLRAKEDYLMGINFSRVLTLKYSNSVKHFLRTDKAVISVGRVMTCVLGMVVGREREIRAFVKTPFYKITASFSIDNVNYEGEWKVTEDSKYVNYPKLYKENGFLEKNDAKQFISFLNEGTEAKIVSITKKKTSKNPPLLYNLAELQNECSKLFKISPDETLKIAQELYEKKLTTYPRTDARVLSSAVAKEITKNLNGIKSIGALKGFVDEIFEKKLFAKLLKSKYVDDKQITDHYAIIPTGQGFNAFSSLSENAKKVYEIIARRFLSIFFEPSVYQKISIETKIDTESFFSNYKTLKEEGYLKVLNYSFSKKRDEKEAKSNKEADNEEVSEQSADKNLEEFLNNLKKNTIVTKETLQIHEGETSPPKQYNSGSIILAMENAGKLIEDEELREQIKGCGIGTSATRAEILKKLISNSYLALNKKTQIITPTLLGEIIYEVVIHSIKSLVEPTLTASWEKGLSQVAEGKITPDIYMEKMNLFVNKHTNFVKEQNVNSMPLNETFKIISKYYEK